mmetsp:Transcript_32818/g.37758  ORF Transcript_32818/g.37758 Transcript_32818/m.37758 type:complete len:152 (+) Transcript_32818:101-556(+)
MICQSTSLTVTIIIDRMSLSKAPPLSSLPYNKSLRTVVYATTRQKRVTRGLCDCTNTKSPLSLSQQTLVNVEEVIFTYSSNSIKNQNIKRELIMQQDSRKKISLCTLLAGDDDRIQLFNDSIIVYGSIAVVEGTTITIITVQQISKKCSHL